MNPGDNNQNESDPAVFLVDDDPSMLILVVRRLAARGHRCLQSCPYAAVFVVSDGADPSMEIAEIVHRHQDPVELANAIGAIGTTPTPSVILLIAGGNDLPRLRAELPAATLIERPCRSNGVAMTVEAEISRLEAA